MAGMTLPYRTACVRRASTLTYWFVAVVVATSIGLLFGADPAHARTFTVNSAADPGTGGCNSTECTLREAIAVSNALPTTDTINFAIPDNPNIAGLEVKTILPRLQLPNITGRVITDGYTQPGAEPNRATTNANSAVVKIQLSGDLAGANATGLVLPDLPENEAGGTTIRGLVINRFGGEGVFVGAGGSVIEGNFIGTDPTSNIARGNAQDGVRIESPGNLIGGPANAAQNVISGNDANGVFIEGTSTTTNNKVEGNYFIGPGANGAQTVGGKFHGVNISGAPGNTVGGRSTRPPTPSPVTTTTGSSSSAPAPRATVSFATPSPKTASWA